MPSTSETGRFWLCPQCKRHAPIRNDECQCGFDRSSLLVGVKGAAPLEPRTSAGASPVRWIPWAVVLVLVGWIGYRELGRASGDRPSATVGKSEEAPRAETPTPSPSPSVGGEGEALRRATTQAEWAALQVTAPSGAPPQATSILQAMTPPPTAQATAQPQLAQASPEAQDPTRTEGYWKQKWRDSRDRVRGSYDQCVHQYALGGTGDFGNTKYAGERGSLVSALEAQASLEEDARRAGVPPGWVRIDYSGYPRMRVRDPLCAFGDSGCSKTAPHPCSIPDILTDLRLE